MAFDVLAFPFIGGRTALNFVGTLGKRGTEDLERIRTVEDLERWAAEAGFGPVSAVEGDLSAARRLRESLYRLTFSAVITTPGRAAEAATEPPEAAAAPPATARPRPGDVAVVRPRPGDVAVVNEWAARGTPVPALTIRTGKVSRNDPATPASAVLAAVARDGIDLLTGPDAALIRECEDTVCTLLFIDTSRSHRRRWCSMNSCGARAKMRTLRGSA
jgi:predicted RNA-binding Zn ribbon-like protein